MVILDVDIATLIGGAGPRIVENGAVGRRGDVFRARRFDEIDVNVPVQQIREEIIRLISIRIVGNTVVGGGAVELRKEQILMSLAVVERPGSEGFQPAVESFAVGKARLVSIPTTGFARGFGG